MQQTAKPHINTTIWAPAHHKYQHLSQKEHKHSSPKEHQQHQYKMNMATWKPTWTTRNATKLINNEDN